MSSIQPFVLCDTDDATATPLASGWRLLEASAGTGKTYTLAGLVLRQLLENRNTSCSRILVITFTRAATAELRERIHHLLGSCLAALDGKPQHDPFVQWIDQRYHNDPEARRRLELARLELDQMPIRTIDSFCHSLLREFAFSAGRLFDQEMSDHHRELDQEIAADFWRLHLLDSPRIITSSLRELHSSVSIKALAELGATCLRHNQFQIHSCDHKLRLSDVMTAMMQSWQELQASWPAARQELIDNIAADRFHGSSMYGNKNIQRMITCIDHFIEYGISLRPDLRQQITRAIIDKRCKKGKTTPDFGFFDYGTALETASQQLKQAIHAGFLQFYQDALQQRLEDRSICAYADIVRWLAEALNDDPSLGTRIGSSLDVAFIDECQDTDDQQFAVFRSIFKQSQHQVYLIGDPKQSIYGFRGADIFSYLDAKHLVQEQFVLNTNYRSDAELVTGCNHLFMQQTGFFRIAGIDYQKVRHVHPTRLLDQGSPASQLVLWDCCNENGSLNDEQRARAIAGEIMRLCRDTEVQDGETTRTLRCSDIAILVRGHHEARIILDQLERRSVPAVVSGGQNVFASPEATELYYLLNACLRRHQHSSLATALSTRLCAYDSDQLASARAADFADEKHRMHQLRSIWQDHGLLSMFQFFLASSEDQGSIRQRILNSERGERMLINLLHLVELLQQQTYAQQYGPAQCLDYLATCISNSSERNEAHELRLSTDDDAVQIMTIHKSKGLQFPVVFVPHANNYKKPTAAGLLFTYHQQTDGHWQRLIDYREKEKLPLQEDEYISEQLRLFYVAVTRAKHRCYIGIDDNKLQCLGHLHEDAAADPHAFYKERCSNDDFAVVWQDAKPTDDQMSVTHRQRPAGTPPAVQSLQRAWSRTSYSALIRHLDHSADHDEHVQLEFSSDDFPRGPQAGNCLHALFEHIPFQAVDDDQTVRRHVAEQLHAHAFHERYLYAATQLLRQTLNSCPPGQDQALNTLDRRDYICELEFVCSQASVSSTELSACLQQYSSPALQEYFQRLAHISISNGYLRGFIDLMFQRDGAWHILDWKSNALAAYDRDSLHQEMCRHDYIFQYHIYTLALHRLLRQRISDYNYEQHVGQVYYAFIRGIDPDKPGQGWYVERPSQALIEALDQLLQEPQHAC